MYSEYFFGKENISDITIEDIVKYFETAKEESNIIEFKSFVSDDNDTGGIAAKEKGILKSICGFLNSEGGLLIWGAPKGLKVEGKKEKSFYGDLSLVEKKYEKDEFIAKIANRIITSPRGIKFKAIETHGKFVYLLDIPKSEYSPHQFENSYYMRLDGQTVAAPHSYIEALFRKISFPNIEGYLKIDSLVRNQNVYTLSIKFYFFNQTRFQNEYDVRYRMICGGGQFENWSKGSSDKIKFSNEGRQLEVPMLKDVLYYGEPIEESQRLIFDARELHDHNYEFNLMVSFGGKLSPMKMNYYRITIGLHAPANLYECISEKRENLYSHEMRENSGSGLSEGDVLNKLLGR